MTAAFPDALPQVFCKHCKGVLFDGYLLTDIEFTCPTRSEGSTVGMLHEIDLEGPVDVNGDGPLARMTQATFRALVAEREQPRVACAAIKVVELVYSLPRPNRHGDIISELYSKHAKWWQSARGEGIAVQGFLLSDGTFANRKRAGLAAMASGEIKKLAHPPELYTEDLW